MRSNDEHDRLTAVPMFRGCSKRELALIGRAVERVHVDAGDTLAEENRIGRELFVIVRGTAEVHRGGTLVATLGPGDYFGELAVLQPGRRNATVRAATPLEVLVVAESSLFGLLSEVPGLARSLLAGLARRLDAADRTTAQLAS